MESEILMQLLDELATLREVSRHITCRLSKTIIQLKINELQSIVETLLSIETE